MEGAGETHPRYLTKQGAQRELDAIFAHARRGQLVAPTGRVGGATFADAAAVGLRYIEHDRKRRPSTVRDYRIVVDNVLVPALGEAELEQLTSAHIDTFRARLVAEGRLSARTINKYLALIHGILKRAQRVYGLAANAAAGVERQPARRSGEFDVLSAEEVEALARAAASPQDAAMRKQQRRGMTHWSGAASVYGGAPQPPCAGSGQWLASVRGTYLGAV